MTPPITLREEIIREVNIVHHDEGITGEERRQSLEAVADNILTKFTERVEEVEKKIYGMKCRCRCEANDRLDRALDLLQTLKK